MAVAKPPWDYFSDPITTAEQDAASAPGLEWDFSFRTPRNEASLPNNIGKASQDGTPLPDPQGDSSSRCLVTMAPKNVTSLPNRQRDSSSHSISTASQDATSLPEPEGDSSPLCPVTTAPKDAACLPNRQRDSSSRRSRLPVPTASRDAASRPNPQGDSSSRCLVTTAPKDTTSLPSQQEDSGSRCPITTAPKETTSPDPRWVISRECKESIANHRAWFQDYTPFISELQGPGNVSYKVLGFGTVLLETQKLPSEGLGDTRSYLEVAEALHVPDAPCNILGYSIVNQCKLELADAPTYPTFKGWFEEWPPIYCRRDDAGNFMELNLSKPTTYDGTSLGRAAPVTVGLKSFITGLSPLSEQETKRMKDLHAAQQWTRPKQLTRPHQCTVPPLTEEEKQWLARTKGTDQHFLESNGLTKDQLCDARMLVRTTMAYEKGRDKGAKFGYDVAMNEVEMERQRKEESRRRARIIEVEARERKEAARRRDERRALAAMDRKLRREEGGWY